MEHAWQVFDPWMISNAFMNLWSKKAAAAGLLLPGMITMSRVDHGKSVSSKRRSKMEDTRND